MSVYCTCAHLCVSGRAREGAQPSTNLHNPSGFRRDNDDSRATHLHMECDRLHRRSRRVDAVDRAKSKLRRSFPPPRRARSHLKSISGGIPTRYPFRPSRNGDRSSTTVKRIRLATQLIVRTFLASVLSLLTS